MISISQAAKGSLPCQSLVCQTLTFSGLNTFSTLDKLTDLVQTKPSKFKKKRM
jgi:hypothetical protein